MILRPVTLGFSQFIRPANAEKGYTDTHRPRCIRYSGMARLRHVGALFENIAFAVSKLILLSGSHEHASPFRQYNLNKP